MPDGHHSARNGRAGLIHDTSVDRGARCLTIARHRNETSGHHQENPPKDFVLALKHRFAPSFIEKFGVLPSTTSKLPNSLKNHGEYDAYRNTSSAATNECSLQPSGRLKAESAAVGATRRDCPLLRCQLVDSS